MKQMRFVVGFAALLLAAVLLPLAPAISFAARPVQQSGPGARIGTWELSSVADWEAGELSGLLVTNNAGGELRMDAERASGTFVSAPFETSFAVNAAGALWNAEIISGTTLLFEVRGRNDEPDDDVEGWGPWQPLPAGGAGTADDDQARTTVDIVELPADSRYLQIRVGFTSSIERASAILNDATITYLSTTQTTPIAVTGLPRRPIFFGPTTLTPRPTVVPRSDWSGRVAAAQPRRANPRGIVIHQIDASPTVTTTLDILRAQLAFQTEVLGWDDLAYHYLISDDGTVFEGRLGGPTSLVDQFAVGEPAVHIALILSRDDEPSTQTQAVLVNLLAWLGEAFDIPPTGEHRVVRGGELRSNIVGHDTISPVAPDPYPPLDELITALRGQADDSTIRSRWYFAEGNVADYSQRLSFYNPTDEQAAARVTLVRPGGAAPQVEIVTVPPQARADLNVNDVLSGVDALPAVVESSAPLLVERSMGLTTDIDGGPGIAELSRVWYFAEGSTSDDTATYLILFNPNAAAVNGTVTYMRQDGTQLEQDIQIAGQARLVIAVQDITLPDGSRPLLNTGFGARVVTSQPIAAERTMRFGPNAAGLHTGRGISNLSRSWYFAEGTTEGEFEMRLLVLNPNDQPANVAATFLDPEGNDTIRRYAIPPRAQLAIDVNDVVPDEGVSATVRSDRAVAVERALIFNEGAAGTISPGAMMPHYGWVFVDGRTTDAEYYLAVSNPNRLPALVTVELSFGDGATGTQSFVVPGTARYTLALHQIYPDEGSITATVRSTQPIVAERSIFPGGGTRGGSTILGFPQP